MSSMQPFSGAAINPDPTAVAIDAANRLLAEHPLFSPEHERGYRELVQAAEGPRGVHAQWLLGAYHLQVTVRPGALTQAARWLQRAADAGLAPAMDRLSDVHLQGLGLPHSMAEAIALQRRLADRGFQRAAWELAYLLDQPDATAVPNDHLDACSAFARACALGYPPAYYSLGLRLAASDPAFGRALLLRAHDGGMVDALAAADELAPVSVAGSLGETWYLRLRESMRGAPLEQLRPEPIDTSTGVAPAVLALEAHLAAIDHPALKLDSAGRLRIVVAARGDPLAASSSWSPLSEQPRVLRGDNFATREECAHLMSKVAASLAAPADFVRRRRSNDDTELEFFSGRGRPLGALMTDAVVRSLERRISLQFETPVSRLEPCAILCYRPGEAYLPHVDYFQPAQIEEQRRAGHDPGGQRIATFLLYLQAPEAGGETVYEKPRLAVQGRRGSALLHYNVKSTGDPDDDSLHSGREVRKGEKWLWRCTLREHPLYSV